MAEIATANLVNVLKAAGENTRVRLLVLLGTSDLNVKDLTRILAQSQPRISRHLKLLAEAGLVERLREGSWVYFRLAAGSPADLVRELINRLNPDDPILVRDRARADTVRQEREAAAQDYFRAHAAEWDKIRALHVAEDEVEAAMRQIMGSRPIDVLADIGTGTGRILELFCDQTARGIGLDISHDMLAYARAKLERGGFTHCQVRHGDLFDLPFEEASVDAVVIHQVLHFLDEPARALGEAARILKPGGKCLIVDFAPHELEFLREQFAHRRLGFAHEQMTQWVLDAGLTMGRHLDLKPKRGHGADRLTVSIWLTEKAPQLALTSKSRRKLRLEGAVS